MEKKRNKIIENIYSLGIVQVFNLIFPLITIPYVSRIIGPDGYGIINYSVAFIGYFNLIIIYGFDLTATKKIAANLSEKEIIDSVFSEVVNARIILFFFTTIIFILSFFLGDTLHKNILVSLFLYLGVIGAVFSCQFIYQAFQELKIFSYFNLFKGILNTVLIFIFIKTKNDYILIPLFTTIFIVTSNLALFFYAYKKFSLNFTFNKISKSINTIFSERFVFFATVLGSFRTTTNTIVLGFFVTISQIGYYTTSLNLLFIVLTIFNVSISTAIYPFISSTFGKSKEEGVEVVKRIMPLLFYIYLLASFFILVFAPIIIRILYGSQFEDSIYVLQIVSFIPLSVGLTNIFGVQLMFNLNLENLYFKITVISTIISLVFNVLLSRSFGIIGAAWSIVICDIIGVVLIYYAVKNKKIEIIDWKYFKPNQLFLLVEKLFLKRK